MESVTRREVLAGAACGAFAVNALAEAPPKAAKVYRIGVISASIKGKPQRTNGHTWHFAQYLHPTCNLDAIKKYLDPGSSRFFNNVVRNPRCAFDGWPFPDTKLTHYYDADQTAIGPFAEAYPGVKAAGSLKELVDQVDAVWLGDASGGGEDHFDLIAPALEKGLPCFCDKPIGGDVAGTRKILEFARKHRAPMMSASCWRYEFGMEAALRLRDAKEFGAIEHVSTRLYSRYSLPGWMVYGQHLIWGIMTLTGEGVAAVSMYEHKDACHGLITYADRYPSHFWFGMPYEKFEYDRTDVYFKKKLYSFTPSIEGDFWYGHHYQMFRMADVFRHMVITGKEPVPHQEILEVTAIVHAAAKSLKEQSRLVKLEEV
jgi:predicted dehydrogenase